MKNWLCGNTRFSPYVAKSRLTKNHQIGGLVVNCATKPFKCFNEGLDLNAHAGRGEIGHSTALLDSYIVACSTVGSSGPLTSQNRAVSINDYLVRPAVLLN